MVRFLLRLTGFVLVAAAFAALIVDGTRSLAAGAVMTYSLGDTAGWLFPSRMAALNVFADHGSPFLRFTLAHALASPTWAAAAVLALLCLVVGRAPPDRLGLANRR